LALGGSRPKKLAENGGLMKKTLLLSWREKPVAKKREIKEIFARVDNSFL